MRERTLDETIADVRPSLAYHMLCVLWADVLHGVHACLHNQQQSKEEIKDKQIRYIGVQEWRFQWSQIRALLESADRD